MKFILLVENDASSRTAYVAGLQKAGFYVGEARNRQEGLEFLARVTPAIAVIDTAIDDGDGFEIISEIHSRFPNVPILAISKNMSHLNLAMQLGATRTLKKPFVCNDLCHTVHNLIAALTTPNAAKMMEKINVARYGFQPGGVRN